ncbi:MAG: prepilin-type N-terminal cleavage/methylation domain-containing protein [Gammaproteobacteria bacterium]|jgi:prepilin-type N-terminal cleavage/methylation domain-containing protein|nr:prepilin-type N-terminal cleavage/methylation domain-containing protein [Gammaproteobacteria bacterium]MBT5204707.1 prepilin-type N-terminal cleavage/methylation domain-containing protein [Gammaproteobacteria bacterium]MBT5602693.1 prepilin-type N-terminal cleavage/methylation domain-containing protein [Gammaproteobacteria bacterium]MBT6246078.1 prepilin-type N-terminal cleavage/methylation domain-containing protein [Gammaproteobacteria bacterium]
MSGWARSRKGFSLLELMIVLVIIGLSLSVALPSYQNMISRFGITSVANDLLAGAAFARSEALKRGGVASLYGSTTATSNRLGSGYCVMSGVGSPGNCTGAIQNFSGSDVNLTVDIVNPSGQIQNTLQFDDLGGLANTNGEIRLINICRTGFVGRQIQISLIGRGKIVEVVC